MDIAGIVAILSTLIGVPCIVFGFVLLNLRGKREIEKLKLQKEMMELEVQKEAVRMRLLEAENRKYDRMIDSRFGAGEGGLEK